MKAISLLIISVFLFFAGTGVFAQETELPNPGLTPDSPFYFLETITEKIGTFFTFGDVKKAERHATLAAERLAEVKAIAEKQKPELVEKILGRYENELENALSRTEKAKTKGKSTVEVVQIISETTQKHISILEEVLEKVPEQAKLAIEHAITVSSEGNERALEAVSSGQDLELIKAKCLELGAPPEVCSSIEQALQSSKPLRTLCLEQGGTTEMCEKLPDKIFKSFKEIEDFCLGMGGPAEICALLEGRCRELGITTPDACFRVLSISSITTFRTTELKAVPKPSLPEGEVQPERIQVETGGESNGVEKESRQRYVPNVSKVIIYLMPNCPHCVRAKERFQRNNIQYEEIDISQNKIKEQELMGKVGQLVVPIIEIDNDIMVGFNEDSLSELFGIE